MNNTRIGNQVETKKAVNKRDPLAILRGVIQLLSFVFFPALFIDIFNSMKAIVFYAFHGQGDFNTVLPSIILLVSVSVVTAVGGRFFCGWMCAFGSMGDLIYHISSDLRKGKKTARVSHENKFKLIKYFLLAAIMVLVWGMEVAAIPKGSNPWEVFGIVTAISQWPDVTVNLKGFLPGVLILLTIAVTSAFVERFFCRYLCPLGAYFSFISRFKPIRIEKPKGACGGCRLCSVKCKAGLDLNSSDEVKTGECISCMKCNQVCPKGNCRLGSKNKVLSPIIVGLICCVLIGAGYLISSKVIDNTSFGSNSENKDSLQIPENISQENGKYEDGIYTGTGKGYRGDIEVEVTVEEGCITGIEIISTRDDGRYINMAAGSIISDILQNQDTDVDSVSGATYSSMGLKQAVEDALSNKPSKADDLSDSDDDMSDSDDDVRDFDYDSGASGSQNPSESESDRFADLEDGTYRGTGTGFRGEVSVSVTVKDGKITGIEVDSYRDDYQFFEAAEDGVISEIISSQTVDVDGVSGATYSSNGIKEAVADALGVDFTPDAIQQGGGHGHHHGRP